MRVESFTVAGVPGEPDAKGAAFVRAMDAGFLEPVRDEACVVAQLDRFRAESTLLTAAYDDDAPAVVDAGLPVATFGDFVGSLAVAPGVVLPAQMITEVTVAGTHRRRGLLTSLMRGALARARADGLALSALTASEGGIYGRFGFGVAAFSTRVRVRAGRGLRLRAASRDALQAAGLRVVAPSWEAFPRLYKDAFAAFQETTPGQSGHTHAYRRRAAGDPNPWAVTGENHTWRPLVALGPDGAARGYAITEFGGFATTPATLHVRDLGAADPLAELALWDALASTDLVQELAWGEAPDDFALPVALVDPRDVTHGARNDHLWLRVLDVEHAYAARGLAVEGSVVLDVEDAQGLCGGRYLVQREGGDTRVRTLAGGEAAADEVPELALDAEALGSLYLGTVSVAGLVGAGRARTRPADVAGLTWLLAPARAPRNSYTF